MNFMSMANLFDYKGLDQIVVVTKSVLDQATSISLGNIVSIDDSKESLGVKDMNFSFIIIVDLGLSIIVMLVG